MAGKSCSNHREYTPGCEPCGVVQSRYDRRRAAKIKDGTWQYRRPVAEVRDHLHHLHRQGMSYTAVARAAGLAKRTVLAVVSENRTWVQGPTAAAIYAVQPASELPKGRIDSTGTTRRLRALIAAGWTMTALAARLGWHIQQVWELTKQKHPTVTDATAATIASLYKELSATPGSSARARNHAARNGWLGPAWFDDDRIDDPDHDPLAEAQAADTTVIDEVAVDRALRGLDVVLTKPERHFAVHEGCRRGQKLTTVALALGMNYQVAKKLAAKPLPAMAA